MSTRSISLRPGSASKGVSSGAFWAVVIISIIILVILGILSAIFGFLWRKELGEGLNNICPVTDP